VQHNSYKAVVLKRCANLTKDMSLQVEMEEAQHDLSVADCEAAVQRELKLGKIQRGVDKTRDLVREVRVAYRWARMAISRGDALSKFNSVQMCAILKRNTKRKYRAVNREFRREAGSLQEKKEALAKLLPPELAAHLNKPVADSQAKPQGHCPSKHALVLKAKMSASSKIVLGCDTCGKVVQQGAQLYSCHECMYDECPDCFSKGSDPALALAQAEAFRPHVAPTSGDRGVSFDPGPRAGGVIEAEENHQAFTPCDGPKTSYHSMTSTNSLHMLGASDEELAAEQEAGSLDLGLYNSESQAALSARRLDREDKLDASIEKQLER